SGWKRASTLAADPRDDGAGGALTGFGLHVHGGFGFDGQSMDDGEAEAGALVGGFRGELAAEDFLHRLRGHARTGVGDGDREQRRMIVKFLAIDEALFGTVLILIERKRML